jgi:hypothetical protein
MDDAAVTWRDARRRGESIRSPGIRRRRPSGISAAASDNPPSHANFSIRARRDCRGGNFGAAGFVKLLLRLREV